ncbi:uncharacterized protein LOC132626169 isoform X2 [Lycium barbarum]|uniref:uncharacterized protein LOC132626169 isoform X2 n=1 Tax=Lycium barbarum TaxID=112863 RepID=UPI00293E7490|nr:uncharacterized protein LOC132626169 isoform X2 [Lycium barbarum]
MSFPTEKAYSSNKNESNSIQDDQIKRAQLKMQFHSTRKGDDETIESYVKRLNSIADSLAAIDSPISDLDMVLQLFVGLPSEYEPVKKIISSKRPLPTFEEACSMVYMQEGILLQINKNESNSIQDDQIKRAQLKMQFHNTRKGDDETIESYVKILNSIADSLAAIDSPISDSDMVLQLLAGLPSEYEPLKKIISSEWPLLTFEEACSMVYMQEGILLQINKNESNSIQDDQMKRAQLKMQFHSTRKGDDETIESYVKILNYVEDSLAAIDSPISDMDMVLLLLAGLVLQLLVGLVLQRLAGLPSQYEPVKKIISSKWPLPTFEEACSMVNMLKGILLQDHHEEQNRSDPRVVGEEESSAFITLEKVATIVGIASTIMGAAATFTTVAGAVSAVGASRMIAIGSMSAVGAVAGWKIWQTQWFNECSGCSGWLENLADAKKK